ncbi:hypothetical protein [Bifidobacterium subtile]|jgi:hypothetical protein|uniref:hypothetical protein n=1 Tax=Bifidobacterium subtile TaxID=77635 RepID=UPI002F3598BB
MTDETSPEQAEPEREFLYPSTISKLPASEQPPKWERLARRLHERNKNLVHGRAKYRAKAEAYAEALDAIVELARNAHIVQ